MTPWIRPLQEFQEGVSPLGDDTAPTYAEVARALGDVLAGPDFRRVEPSVVESWLVAAWEAFRDLLRAIPLQVPEGAGAAAAWLLAVALASAAAIAWVILLGHWAARFLGDRDGRDAPDDDDGAQPATAAEWLRLAAARAADGNLRAAATVLYQGVLRVLDGKGVVHFHRSKTPGEYMVEAARHGGEPGAAATTFLRLFQRFRFGDAAPTLSAYRRLEEQARLNASEAS